MRIHSTLKRAVALACAASCGALTSNAIAQDEPFLEEIVVTAAKREQTLQEVPIAVSVTSEETIQNSKILDVLDLQSVVPSLRVNQLQSSQNTNFVIRGFGNGANNPGIEPSVGVFIDGVYRSRSASALADLPNLQRVEVLRGPQSTLFGKNASAGVISIITQAPQFETEGSAELIFGNYGQTVAKGSITGPISENLAYSLSGSYNSRDGYFDNIANGNEINARERWALRGQLLWEPSESVSFRLIADTDEIDENCCGTTNLLNGPTGGAIALLGGQLVPDDAFSYQTALNRTPTNEIENSGVSLQADIDFENFTLTSITAFRTQSLRSDGDVDYTSADLVASNKNNWDIDTITQEIRLQGSFGNAADWMIGGFYFNEDVAYDTGLLYGDDFRGYADILAAGGITATETALGLPAGTFFASGTGIDEDAGQDDTAISFFTTVDWYVTDRATITAGLNYTQNEKEAFVSQVNTDVFSGLDFQAIGFAGVFGALTGLPPTPDNIAANPVAAGQAQAISTTACSAANPPPGCNELLALQPLQFLPPFVDFPNSVENGITDESDTTWTLRFAYDVNENLNWYISAATGFKASSWNLSRDARPFAADLPALQAAGLTVANLTTGTRFAGPEEATVYELGLKGQYDRTAFNLTFFEQSIEGFQSNTFTGTGFNLINAGEQSTQGIEYDMTYYPTDALEITFAATWLDPKYDEFRQSVVGDLTGERPAGIPQFASATTGTYRWDLSGGQSLFIRAEHIFEGEHQIVENIPEDIATRKVSMFNASAGISFVNGWDLQLWGRNLNDDEFLLSAFPGVAQNGSFNGYPSPPRTYGLSIRKIF
ncbi:MAG: TonB-dependent receptor [Pseudomonadota bacterium]